MTDSKTSPSTTEAETILDNEALADVQGGALRVPASILRLDLPALRERLGIGLINGNFGNYHVKDSGPSWVNSPRLFDRGSILTLPVLNRL